MGLFDLFKKKDIVPKAKEKTIQNTNSNTPSNPVVESHKPTTPWMGSVRSVIKVKEVYDRIGVCEASAPTLEHLPNGSDILTLVEIWDGGPMEGHLFIQKDNGNYILYEIIHYFNSKSETVKKYTLKNPSNLQNIVNEIEDFCKNRYEGTLNFDFSKIQQDKAACVFLGF